MNEFFFLHPHVLLVKGSLKGGLYDLKGGGVFQISRTLKVVLEKLEAGIPLNSISTDQSLKEKLIEIETLNLGYFTEFSVPPKKIVIDKPKPQLQMLWLSLNSNCNLVCEHCYATSEPGPFDCSIDFQKLFNALEEARNIFNVQCVQLIGGEPLLLGKSNLHMGVRKRML